MGDEQKRRISVKVVKGNDAFEEPALVAFQKGEQKQSRSEDAFEGQYQENDIVEPPYPQGELADMVEYSSILQQCVDAYKRNITGFGTKVAYTTDDTVQETPEMKAEKKRVESFVNNFNFDQSFEDVWGDALGNREQTGNGYIEIIRDGKGDPAEGYSIHPREIRLTPLGKQRVEVQHVIDGVKVTRQRRFRKFVQQLHDGEYVWFKEFGDPRRMDSRTGKYEDEISEVILPEFEATEIIHLKIGTRPYGVPRWIGQLIHMYGARKAEELNYNYFYNGRHNPAALIVNNGLLTAESEAALQSYSKTVGGTDNAHKFLIIEIEGTSTDDLPGEEKQQTAKAEFKSLADMLQEDALFLEYDDASREKVQSAFRLPDIYVGRSKDFNRATADTARYITEEQVFEPERNTLEFTINNLMFRELNLKFTKLEFEKPEISNVDDLTKILNTLNAIGAVAPNDVRDLLSKVLNKPVEDIDGDIANLPAKIASMLQAQHNIEQKAQQQGQQGHQQPQQGTKQPTKGGKQQGQQKQPKNGDNKAKPDQQKVQKNIEEFVDILKDIRDEVELYENGKVNHVT